MVAGDKYSAAFVTQSGGRGQIETEGRTGTGEGDRVQVKEGREDIYIQRRVHGWQGAKKYRDRILTDPANSQNKGDSIPAGSKQVWLKGNKAEGTWG